ncbi:hypothetical protein BKH46_06505 [Helicobacter sp. 12S02634-8]|uniref:hypothetical protein n=1 Tax=Helicobacter sp. 12S02634-8 TaxID=1476199 RepID=UPI000BA5C67D|nr:hypothetical protein [Helicobacter sp. 12S02634-8]PAF46618.1 hypothetical protein BKH46_06505 [Helicobacter sp. 12S02634-8]
MQTFPHLRRNSTFKETLKALTLLVSFGIYTCLNDIFLFLPPMIGVLFILYAHASKKNQWIKVLAIVACLIFFELDHNKPAGILPIVFVIANWLVVKKFRLLFEENIFFVFVYVPLIYFIYFFVLYLFGMFDAGFDLNLNLILIAYIFYESCLGIIYEKIRYQI